MVEAAPVPGVAIAAFPIVDVDIDSRRVEGLLFEHIDPATREVVDFDALKSALGRWRGTVLEMQNELRVLDEAPDILADDEERDIAIVATLSRDTDDVFVKAADGTLGLFTVEGSCTRSPGAFEGHATTIVRFVEITDVSLSDTTVRKSGDAAADRVSLSELRPQSSIDVEALRAEAEAAVEEWAAEEAEAARQRLESLPQQIEEAWREAAYEETEARVRRRHMYVRALQQTELPTVIAKMVDPRTARRLLDEVARAILDLHDAREQRLEALPAEVRKAFESESEPANVITT